MIQGTASEANLVALLAARARALAGRPAADALRLVAYASDQARAALNPIPEPCITKSSTVWSGHRSRTLQAASAGR